MKVSVLFTIVLITLNTYSLFAQNYQRIETLGEYQVVSKNGEIGLIDGDVVLIPFSNYSKIEYDEEAVMYKCYKENEFEIFFYDFKKLTSNYLFTEIVSVDEPLIKVKGKEGFGYIYNHQLIVPPIYDKITLEIETYFHCCYNLILEKDGLIGINLGRDSNVLDVVYDKIYEVKNSELYIIEKEGELGLIKPRNYPEKEVVILPPEFSKIENINNPESADMQLYVTKGGGIGCYDVDSEMFILEPLYSELSLLSSELYDYFGYFPLFLGEKNNKKGLVAYEITDYYSDAETVKSVEVIPFIYDELDILKYTDVEESYFRYLKIPAVYNAMNGYVIKQMSGPLLSLPSFVQEILTTEEGFYFMIKDTLNKYSIWEAETINGANPKKYDNLSFLKKNPEFEYMYIVNAEIEDKKGFVLFGSYYKIGDKKTREYDVWKCLPEELTRDELFVKGFEFLNEELLIITDFNNKSGVARAEAFDKFIIPQEFDEIELSQGDYFLVKQNNKWGLIDYYGKVLQPCIYEKPGDVVTE
jgi:hypothetical protein